jgi:hypothetical protein
MHVMLSQTQHLNRCILAKTSQEPSISHLEPDVLS